MIQSTFIKTQQHFSNVLEKMFDVTLFQTKKNYANPWNCHLSDLKEECKLYLEIIEAMSTQDVFKACGDPVKEFYERATHADIYDREIVYEKALKHQRASSTFHMHGYHIVSNTIDGDSLIIVATSLTTYLHIYLDKHSTNIHNDYIQSTKQYYGGLETFLDIYLNVTSRHVVSSHKTDMIAKAITRDVSYRALYHRDKETLYIRTTHLRQGFAGPEIKTMLRLALAIFSEGDEKLTLNLVDIYKAIDQLIPSIGLSIRNGLYKTILVKTYYIGIASAHGDCLEFFITDARSESLMLEHVLKN